MDSAGEAEAAEPSSRTAPAAAAAAARASPLPPTAAAAQPATAMEEAKAEVIPYGSQLTGSVAGTPYAGTSLDALPVDLERGSPVAVATPMATARPVALARDLSEGALNHFTRVFAEPEPNFTIMQLEHMKKKQLKVADVIYQLFLPFMFLVYYFVYGDDWGKGRDRSVCAPGFPSYYLGHGLIGVFTFLFSNVSFIYFE